MNCTLAKNCLSVNAFSHKMTERMLYLYYKGLDHNEHWKRNFQNEANGGNIIVWGELAELKYFSISCSIQWWYTSSGICNMWPGNWTTITVLMSSHYTWWLCNLYFYWQLLIHNGHHHQWMGSSLLPSSLLSFDQENAPTFYKQGTGQ